MLYAAALRTSNVAVEVPVMARGPLVAGLKEMAPALREIAERGEQLGLDADVVVRLAPGLREQAARLDALVRGSHTMNKRYTALTMNLNKVLRCWA